MVPVERKVVTYHYHNMKLITIGNTQRCLLALDTINGRRVERSFKPTCCGIVVPQRLIDELDDANVSEVIATVYGVDYPFIEFICALCVRCRVVERCVLCVL